MKNEPRVEVQGFWCEQSDDTWNRAGNSREPCEYEKVGDRNRASQSESSLYNCDRS